jgi:hypothetical protein
VAVTTVGAILGEAEGALEAAANYNTTANFTPKPMPTLEVSGEGWAGMRMATHTADTRCHC